MKGSKMLALIKLLDDIVASSGVIRMVIYGALVVLFISTCYLFVVNKYKAVRIDSLQRNVAEISAQLNLQNNMLKKLGEDTVKQKEVVAAAVEKAKILADINKKILEDMTRIKLEGTCDEKVKQSLRYVTTK